MSDSPSSVDGQAGNVERDFHLQPGDVLFMSAESVANPGFPSAARIGDDVEAPTVTKHIADARQTSVLERAELSAEAAESFVDCFGTEPGHLAVPGIPTAECLFVLSVESPSDQSPDAAERPETEGTVIAVRLGVMSTDAVANHLPDLANALTKPKVFFIGGDNEPVVLGVAHVEDPRGGDIPLDPHAAAQRGVMLFGKNAQFLYIHTNAGSPSLDEQIKASGGELRGARLFHSYVATSLADVEEWIRAGYVHTEPAEPEDVMTSKPGETWRTIMARRPFPQNLFSTWALHPERN